MIYYFKQNKVCSCANTPSENCLKGEVHVGSISSRFGSPLGYPPPNYGYGSGASRDVRTAPGGICWVGVHVYVKNSYRRRVPQKIKGHRGHVSHFTDVFSVKVYSSGYMKVET